MNPDVVLGLLGLSCGGIALIGLGLVALQIVAIHLGAALVGLHGTLGRAASAFLATACLAIPGIVVLSFLELPATTHDLLTAVVFLTAGALALRWLYHTQLSRALLGYLLAGVIELAVLIPLVLIVY